jgi:hypothetical protein
LRLRRVVRLVAIFFARREDFVQGGTGILPVRTAKMAVPRLGCGSVALQHTIPIRRCREYSFVVMGLGVSPDIPMNGPAIR